MEREKVTPQEPQAVVTLRKLELMDYFKLRPIYTNPHVTYPAALAPITNEVDMFKVVRVLVAMENDAIEAEGRLVGVVGYDAAEEAEKGENAVTIGYVLREDAWGHGYGTQAVRMYSDKLLEQGYDAVYADCFLDNPASARVLEKAGFVYQHDFVRSFSCFPEPRQLHLYRKTR